MTQEALKLAEIIEHFDSNDESLPLELLKEISATLRALAQTQEPVVYQCPRCATSMQVDLTAKAALAQTQEPVAWYHAEDYKTHFTTNPSPDLIGKYWKPLYTHPPQRKPLTENAIKHLWYEACQTNLELTSQLIVHLARNIEAAHSIKE